jgi:hypothetical protein
MAVYLIRFCESAWCRNRIEDSLYRDESVEGLKWNL